MTGLGTWYERLRGFDLERMAGLRPSYPPVAVEMNRDEMVLVRCRRRRGGPTLQSHAAQPMPEQPADGSILRPNLAAPDEVAQRLGRLFEAGGVRPGRLSLVLPDNLAKVSLITLPERPPSRRQLEEVIRFKVRRSVPFRLEDAAMSYQLLPGERGGLGVLVALMRRGVVEQYERVLESCGARVGLFDLCTPNLFNLARGKIAEVAGSGADVGLLNATPSYFSLLIVRGERLIFYRCKTHVGTRPGDGAVEDGSNGSNGTLNGTLQREMASSLSYYQEKLSGQGLHAVFVRSVAQPVGELRPLFRGLGIDRVEAIDPAASLRQVDGMRLDSEVAHRIAPALGAAAGRGR